MHRVLLIANANAHTVTPYARDVISRALASGTRLETVETKRQGHATHVARGAAHEGVDLVVALGGDGTVNEVVNGLAGSTVPLAVLPGGGANVFARGLGMPNDPIEATGWLLDRLDAEPTRIPLGRVNGRYFVSNCGVGLDAAIVREVERRQFAKRIAGDAFFVWTALRVFFTGYDRRHPHLRISWGEDLDGSRDGVFLAISQKADPFTYLGARPMRVCPEVTREGGLDLVALDRMRPWTVLAVGLRSFGSAPKPPSGRHVLYLHDEPRIRIECDEPVSVQADGELLGEQSTVDLETEPDALSIVV